MNDKVFYGIIGLLVIGVVGFAIFAPKPEKLERVGNEQANQGREHLKAGETATYDDSLPPTSGSHGAPIGWGEYPTPVPEENVVHDMEHGGIYVSYNPDLVSEEDLESLRGLFFKPYSNSEFAPTKVVMAPRPENEAPIVLASWDRNQVFETFNEEQMIAYYKTNVNKSPEIAG